jgi:hypothetical protein
MDSNILKLTFSLSQPVIVFNSEHTRFLTILSHSYNEELRLLTEVEHVGYLPRLLLYCLLPPWDVVLTLAATLKSCLSPINFINARTNMSL